MSLFTYFHTHWDREWYEPFRTYQYRLIGVAQDLLHALQNNTLSCFALDGQMVLWQDLEELSPETTAGLAPFVREGRLSIGPWFVMPDSFLVSGESLLRNLKLGIQQSKALGQKEFTGYLPDTFGHPADMPLILRHCQIESAVVWRGVPLIFPYFNWQSLNGDSVFTLHLTQGYFHHALHMGKTHQEKQDLFLSWQKAIDAVLPERDLPRLYPIGADHLGIVTDTSPVPQLAEAKAVTLDAFMKHSQSAVSKRTLESLEGELRDHTASYLLPGTYSSRLYLKKWNRVLEWRLTKVLEPFCTWAQINGLYTLNPYIHQLLWKTLLLNHPHDSICGCSLDSVHRENEVRFEQIDQLSTSVLRDVTHRTLTFFCNDSLVAFNWSSVPYTGVIELLETRPLPAEPFVLDHSQIVTQTIALDRTDWVDNHTLPLSENKARETRALIWVEHLKPMGAAGVFSAPPPQPVLYGESFMENEYLKLSWSKESGLTTLCKVTGKISAAISQLWQLPEQGDSYNAAPDLSRPRQQASIASIEWQQQGPLRATIKLTYQLAFPLTLSVQLDAGSRYVVFEVLYTNTEAHHKLQFFFPSARPIDSVVAEGHFNPVYRTYHPDYRIEELMPAEPGKELLVQGGPIQRFIGWQDQTLLTEGLTEYEVEGNTLKLTILRTFSMLSRDDTGVRGSHAGPPIDTPEGECLHRKQSYRYAWSPQFDYSQALHDADWFYGAQFAYARTEPTKAPLTPQALRTLPRWDNPHISCTACYMIEGGALHLRLSNATSTPQAFQLQGFFQTIHVINALGEILQQGKEGSSEFVISSYSLLTLELTQEVIPPC
jgi:mannosylglycerate hydrolase